jgi:indole-3-acetate monooxygenase
MGADATARYLDSVDMLAPMVRAAVEENERTRRLSPAVASAMAEAGLFRLWVPNVFGGEEAAPLVLDRVVEALSRIDGATGWCLAIGAGMNALAGLLPAQAAERIYGSDPRVVTSGAFRPFGRAVVTPSGYRVTGQWPLASGCHHSTWLLGGCMVMENGQPRLRPDGAPVMRLMLFPASECTILDTWHSAGLRGTGSHDFTLTDAFVPADYSVSFREPPTERGPLYALPYVAASAPKLASVALGIARHAIDIMTEIAETKISTRARQTLDKDVTVQSNLGRAEALVRSGRSFLHEVVDEAWQTVTAGRAVSVRGRAMLWLASTHAAHSAVQATELIFAAGGSAALYEPSGLGRCLRDVHAVGQHITLAAGNYGTVGQALLGADMSSSVLLWMDDRGDR